jgi:hypothetical protein
LRLFALFRRRDPRQTVDDKVRDAAAPDALDWHRCVICGNALEGDPEDELDGEGPGRDICGSCNRTRNWEAIEEVEWFSDHDS